MKGTYQQNKLAIYNWREKNNTRQNQIRMRAYYKNKISSVVWRNIMYEFLDILRDD